MIINYELGRMPTKAVMVYISAISLLSASREQEKRHNLQLVQEERCDTST
jgi:hypothetical protein